MIFLEDHPNVPIEAAVFDFDGTISTLRCGWETVMEPLMLEYISGSESVTDDLRREVRDFIDRSTGIQTILQMKWLAQQAHQRHPDLPDDPWYYKNLYRLRLIDHIAGRIEDARHGNAESYLISGSKAFLETLKNQGVALFAASGTDQTDVCREADLLGVADLFTKIEGAMPLSEACSKEATLRMLIGKSGYDPAHILVVGDGPVEIRLGREFGALTLGIASDEVRRQGLNDRKVQRLTAAGAHAITDCFVNQAEIMDWLTCKIQEG